MLDFRNVVSAVGKSLIYCLQVEISELPVLRPPPWIRHFLLAHTVFSLVSSDCLIPEKDALLMPFAELTSMYICMGHVIDCQL